MTTPSNELQQRLEMLEQENRRLRRSVQELSLLNDLAREIGASNDTDEIMRTIVRRAIRNLQAEQGVITLIEDRNDDPMTTLVRTGGTSEELDPLRLNDSLMGWMMHNRRPLLLNDPRNDDRFRGTRWEESVETVLCVPLLLRSRLVGILTIYNKKVPGGFTEDDQRLLAIIATQSAQIIENARLVQEEKALARMRQELRLAHEIQTSLLPTAPPEIPGYDVAGLSRPAQTVGGDYYDYLTLADGCYGLCVGDASGKGLPASLLMAGVQATLRGQASWTTSPSTCLNRANDLLSQRTRRGSFVTLFYGVLDTDAHVMHFANAGHNRPLFCTAAGEVRRLELGGVMLGFMSGFSYEEGHLAFGPGDVLLLYSDGVTEAMNTGRDQFEEQRLVDLVRQYRAATARELIDHVVAAVRAHAGPAPPSDDLTVLALKRGEMDDFSQ